jgi:hypothetical protein
MNDPVLNATAWASAIRRGSTIFVHSSYQKERGWLIGTSPYITLAGSAAAKEIGMAVKRALAGSDAGGEKPVDGRAAMEATHLAFGVSSEPELAVDALLVEIALVASDLVITPTENHGEDMNWNFVHLPSERVVISVGAADQQIGAAVQTGWERCSSAP